MNIKQTDWVRCLANQSQKELSNLLDKLSTNWQVAPKQLTQTGLAALKMQESAFNDPFFIGEIPLASAWVVIKTENGQQYEGAAYLMDDDAQKIESLALCDAILNHQLAGWEQVYAFVEQGMKVIELEQLQRKKILSKTTVDFALLNASENDDE